MDSSALGRRYLAEVGSAWVLSWLPKAAGHVVIVSELAPVELYSTFARLQRDGRLPAAVVTVLQTALLIDMQREYVSVALETSVLSQARTLVSRHPLRTLDAIQLSCAQSAAHTLREPLMFVSGDNRLLAAAAAEGFVTDNPYLHP